MELDDSPANVSVKSKHHRGACMLQEYAYRIDEIHTRGMLKQSIILCIIVESWYLHLAIYGGSGTTNITTLTFN